MTVFGIRGLLAGLLLVLQGTMLPTAADANGAQQVAMASPLPVAEMQLTSALRDHPLWVEAVDLERRDRFLESSAVYRRIAADRPEIPEAYWRVARTYWRQGESLPTEQKEERLAFFELSDEWASRGLEKDPDCGGCLLWKASSVGRLATTRGVMSAASNAKDLVQLLERGIEVKPTTADTPDNTTLGNLYYGAAVVYRILPDWWWIRWMIGVRGDKERSLDYIRTAVAISEARVDYRIELGAVLTCIGTSRGDDEALKQGADVLRHAQTMPPVLSTDPIDVGHAGLLLEQPDLACGYSRDGFIDVAGTSLELKYDKFNRTPGRSALAAGEGGPSTPPVSLSPPAE